MEKYQQYLRGLPKSLQKELRSVKIKVEPPVEWDKNDVYEYMKTNFALHSYYSDRFLKADIDGRALVELSKEKLREQPLDMGPLDADRLARNITELNNKKQD